MIIAVGVLGNIVFSFLTTDIKILPSLIEFSLNYFILAIMLSIVPWVTSFFRLLIWTRFLGKRLSFSNVFQIELGAELGRAITPTAIGSGPAKMGMLIKEGIKPGTALSLITLANIENIVFFFFAIPAALTISSSWYLLISKEIAFKLYQHLLILLITIFFIVMVLFLSIFSLFLRLKEKTKIIWLDFKMVYQLISHKGKFRFILTLLLTTIQWVCRYSVISALLMSLGISVDPIRFFVLQWLVFTLMIFIPTPGAIGGAEASFYFIYHLFVPAKLIGLVVVAWRFLTFYLLVGLSAILFVLFDLFNLKTSSLLAPRS
jgi:hypothetical protein